MWHLQHFICCLVRKFGITSETLVSLCYITQENYELDFLSDSDIVKRNYIFESVTATPRALSTNAIF